MPRDFLFINHFIMYKFTIVLLLFFSYACGSNSLSGPFHEEEGHRHEDALSESTLFTDNSEFYIEHDLLQKGKESAFLVHVTRLESYEPCLSGTLSIRLDNTEVTAELERPGIFHMELTPLKEGEFEVIYTLNPGPYEETVSDHIHIAGDHQIIHETPNDHNHEGESHEPAETGHDPGEILYPKEQSWKNDFMVSMVRPVPFSSVILTSGEILAMPGEKKNVSANSGGILVFNEKNLVQGSPVKKGQLLFTISSSTFTEDNRELQLQESLNSFAQSKSEYERHLELYASRVISERLYIESRSRYTADSLRYYSLASNISEQGLRVTSPVSGYIHQLNVSEGQYVETGELLVTISSNKVLLLRADLPQQFYSHLEEIETANFRPAYTAQTYGVEDLNGRLLARGSSVAENDHYLPVYFEVENDGSLLEGSFTEFFLKSRNRKSTITVPVDALLEEQGAYYLYVQVTGESYTKRAVKPGENDGKKIEILEGLKPGERVVTEGTILLKAAATVTSVTGDGHNH